MPYLILEKLTPTAIVSLELFRISEGKKSFTAFGHLLRFLLSNSNVRGTSRDECPASKKLKALHKAEH